MFIWDPNKNKENKEKHGISFEEAAFLWDIERSIDLTARAQSGEERLAKIGKLSEKCYVAIYTMREGNIRIISVRRARPNEEELLNERYR